MTEKRLVSVKDACDYLGVSRMTLLDAEAKGLLKPERTAGGHRRYTRDTLEAFLQHTRVAHEERQFISPANSAFLLPHFISRLSAQPVSPDELLNEALRNLVVLLQADIGAVFTIDVGGRLRLQASFGIPRWALKDLSFLSKHGMSSEAVRRRQPLVYAAAESEMSLRLEAGQGICAPLVYRDQVLGVVHVISSHRYQFFPSEINIAATIAVYLASLIVNSQLLVEQQLLLKELSLLNKFSSAMETRSELGPVLQTFLDETLMLMRAEAGCVFLRDPSGERLYVTVANGFPETIHQFSIPKGAGIVGWVVEHGQPHFSPRLADDPLFTKHPAVLAGKIVSNICLPLRSAGETIGAFNISTHSPRTFSPDEIRFLTTIGNQAAVIVHRTLLLEEASRQAQAERQMRDYYEAIVESLPVGMVMVNADLRIALWNSAMERMTKVKRMEAIGRNPREVFSPMEKAWQMMEESMRTGESRLVRFCKHLTPRGKSGICEALIIPIQRSGGNLAATAIYVYVRNCLSFEFAGP
jgi:PAS domain S-box-containing protein/excisionase family DNA binding protein